MARSGPLLSEAQWMKIAPCFRNRARIVVVAARGSRTAVFRCYLRIVRTSLNPVSTRLYRLTVGPCFKLLNRAEGIEPERPPIQATLETGRLGQGHSIE